MSNQEIFEMLSENECKLFYAHCAEPENKELAEAHKLARQALIAFATATGLTN